MNPQTPHHYLCVCEACAKHKVVMRDIEIDEVDFALLCAAFDAAPEVMLRRVSVGNRWVQVSGTKLALLNAKLERMAVRLGREADLAFEAALEGDGDV